MVQLPDGSVPACEAAGQRRAAARGPHAAQLERLRAALKSGDIGFAESYIAGDWTTPNLTDLLKVFIATATPSRT
jgi:cyclopropane-fatty-acyl-phospholipid synthase